MADQSTDQFEKIKEKIKADLARVVSHSKSHGAGRSVTARIQNTCVLDGRCPQCGPHRGVQLTAGGSTIVAALCSCVKSCRACGGSCMKPQGASVAPCFAPHPKQVVGIINEARIPARYLDADLGTFDGFGSGDRTQKTTVLNWIKGLSPGKSSGLLLSGPVGVGKSWLLAAFAKHLAFRGISVRYADFFQLVHELRDAYANDLADKATLRPLHNVDVLIIDELGKGRNTEWELSVADSLVSDRYNGNKCVIAATNYPLRSNGAEHAQRQIDYLRSDNNHTNQMNATSFEPLSQRIGVRMFSRLSENCICMEVTGPDRRRR